jgi:hypothetical protein
VTVFINIFKPILLLLALVLASIFWIGLSLQGSGVVDSVDVCKQSGNIWFGKYRKNVSELITPIA